MNFGLNRKSLLTICLTLAGSLAAFAQTSDTTSVHAIDTLSFDQAVSDPVVPFTPNNNDPQGDPAATGATGNPADTAVAEAPAATSPANATGTDGSSTATASSDSLGGAAGANAAGAGDDGAAANRSKQRAFTGYSKFRRFSIGIDGGPAIFGSLGVNDYRKNNMSGAVGLNATYFFGRAFALQGDFHYNLPMQGSIFSTQGVPDSSLSYTANIMDFSVSGVFHLGNINFTSKKNKIMVFASVGAGMCIFSTDLTMKYPSPLVGDTSVSRSGSAIIIPVGLGVKYMLGKNMTFKAGYTVKFADSDYLDNTPGNFNTDKYTYGYVGVAYTLGNKKKPTLEWNNAALAMYDDLSGNDRITPLKKRITSMQEQLDSLSDKYKRQLDSMKTDMEKMIAKGGSSSMGQGMTDASGKALDSDGDGIADMYDRCPFEKGTQAFGGCPKRPVKAGAKETSNAKEAENKIFFEKNTKRLSEDSYKALDNLAASMEKNPGYKLLISGYTDADGDKTLNEQLSLERANVVKAYLVKKGVEESRLKTEGLGEKVYLDNNVTSAGKRNNRVVTLEFVTY